MRNIIYNIEQGGIQADIVRLSRQYGRDTQHSNLARDRQTDNRTIGYTGHAVSGIICNDPNNRINILSYWNNRVYGNGLNIGKYRKTITTVYLILSVLIPIIVPIWITPIIYKNLPEYIRYDLTKKC